MSPPQSQPTPGTDQVENSAGGFAWKVDPWTRLHRFLILGSEGGSYYASERTLTGENVECLAECVKEDARRVLDTVLEISHAGRAAKNDPAIFALAYVSVKGDTDARRRAFNLLPRVCRIATHLYHFCNFREAIGGRWGRGMRNAVSDWYLSQETDQLANQLVKYRQRDGWSHRDLFRKAHPRASTGDSLRDNLFAYAAGKWQPGQSRLPNVIEGYARAQDSRSASETASLIREYGLTREMVQTDHLSDRGVWGALIESMPMTAMIRNLGNMSKVGLLTPSSTTTAYVCDRLTNAEALHNARIHPIQALAALVTYNEGHSARGEGVWDVTPQIVDALDTTYELSFANVEPVHKRFHLGIDVSGSMGIGTVSGVPGLTPRVAAAAMAMITARTEPMYSFGGFTHTYEWLDITARTHLRDVAEKLHRRDYGRTDCAQPVIEVEKRGLEVDVFCIYTDNETWFGDIHPHAALENYRQVTGIDAKMVVCGMVANPFSIANPDDPGMLDVVGFDTTTPQVINEFAKGF